MNTPPFGTHIRLGGALVAGLLLAASPARPAPGHPPPASRIAPAGPVSDPRPPGAAARSLLIPLMESGHLAPEDLERLATAPTSRILDRIFQPRGAAAVFDCVELADLDRPAAPESLDVLHYDIRADSVSLVNESFHAVTGITFRALKPLRSVDFDLTGVQITAVLAGRPGTTVPVAYDLVDSVLHVQLPQEIPTDSTGLVTVDYRAPDGAGDCLNAHGMPSGWVFTRSGAHTFGEPTYSRHWYPCHDVPWDKATATLVLTVPSGLVGSASGVLTDSVKVNGLDRLTWSVPVPVSNYLLAFYISDYRITRLTSPGGIPLEYFVYPRLETAAGIDFQHVPDMVDFFSAFYPYPYPRYAMSLGFFGGGMEHVMNSLIGEFFLLGDLSYETLFAHELAHQWWGDLVTTDSWRDVWLNEGFATYAEAMYTEHAYGWDAMRERTAFIDSIYIARLDDIDHPLLDPPVENVFDFVVYQKGGRTLDMLRGVSRLRLMRGPARPPEGFDAAALAGDDRFYRIFTRYTGDHAYANVTTLDFQREAEAQLGEDLTWFFDPWLRGAGFPDIAYDWTATTTPSGVNLDVQVKQVQTWATRFRMPLQVRYRSGGTVLDEVRTLREDATEWVVSLPPGDWQVELDPDDWMLDRHRRMAVTPEPRPGAVFPNPSATGFSILDTLPGESPARVILTVLDVQGRRVWEEDLGRQPPGPLALRWEGRDLSGRRARPGAYYARLRMGPRTAVRGLVVLPGPR